MTPKQTRVDSGVLLDLTIPSNPEILCVVRGVITGLATLVGFTPADCRSITRATDEGLANVIRHAYQSRKDQRIEVVCRRTQVRVDSKKRTGLEITLVDYGPAFNPTRLQVRSLEQVRPGGLGLHFIRESMDSVSYRRSGNANRLSMVRYLPKPKLSSS